MSRKIACLLVLVLLAPVICACPKEDGQGASSGQNGSPRTPGKKMRLELKFAPGSIHQSMLNTKLDARIVIEALDSKGKPVASTMTSTTASNFHRTVTDGSVEGGKLLREIKAVAGVIDKTQSETGIAVRRMLILEGGKLRVTELGKQAEPTSDETALGEALGLPKEMMVTKQAKIERVGDAWSKLAVAQASPVFPYIDTERLTELALELPGEDVRVGDTWERKSQLQVGDASLKIALTSKLQQVQDAGGARMAQLQIQLQGANAGPITLTGGSGEYGVSTVVDRLVLDGTITVILDLKNGRVQSLAGDLLMSLSLNTKLEKDGKEQVLRVKVDNANMRITEDLMYDPPIGKA